MNKVPCFIILIACIVNTALGVPPIPDECKGTQAGPGSFYFDLAHVCYEFFDVETNYATSQKICSAKGATLAMPKSPEELDAIWTNIQKQKPGVKEALMWIGLDDLAKHHEYMWNDNEPLSWANWNRPGFNPAAQKKGLDCVYILLRPGEFDPAWTPYPCDHFKNPICQYQIPEKENPSGPGAAEDVKNVTVVSRECLSEPLPGFELPPGVCDKRKDSCKHEVVQLSNGKTILCDTNTDGGGWIVFQRQTKNTTLFLDSGKEDYIHGFGEINGTFWWGLDNIHGLCNKKQPCELRAEMRYNGEEVVVNYRQFHIAGRSDNFTISISGFEGNEDDNVLGSTDGKDFVTKDDSDAPMHPCSSETGAWWFDSECAGYNVPIPFMEDASTEVKMRRVPPKKD